MNPQLEQRLRKLEEKTITARELERHIQIRWIRKGEGVRPGLRHFPNPVADSQPKLPDSDGNSTEI